MTTRNSSITLLDDLGRHHGTEKVRKFHGYTSLYAMLLGARRALSGITEVGVFKGASALMWTDFFPNARTIGVSITGQRTRR